MTISNENFKRLCEEVVDGIVSVDGAIRILSMYEGEQSADLPEAGNGYALLGEVMEKIDLFLGFLGLDDFDSKEELDWYFKGVREVKTLIKVLQDKLKTNFA